jgi:hypothetical protein
VTSAPEAQLKKKQFSLDNQRGLHAAKVLCMYADRTVQNPGQVFREYELVRYPDTRQQRPRVPNQCVCVIDCETKKQRIGKNPK